MSDGQTCTVGQGECLSSIASTSGVPAQDIWHHPENARLRALRPSPNVLLPGDVLFVPAVHEQYAQGVVDKRHRFRIYGDSIKLRLALYNDKGPRQDEAYQLEVGAVVREGKTDKHGRIEEIIPAAETSGRLVMKQFDKKKINNKEEYQNKEVYELMIGCLDPVTDASGFAQRLANLAFMARDSSPPAPKEACQAYQATRGIVRTEAPDATTSEDLKAVHGS